MPPLSTQSVDLQKAIDFNLCVCIQQLELHMKPDTNNSARKLYIFRTISNAAATELNTFVAGKEIGFLFNKNLLFPCYTVFVFPSFLVLRVLFVSRIPILVTFEQQAKTLPTPESLAPSQLRRGKTNSCRFWGSYCGWYVADHAICAISQKYGQCGFLRLEKCEAVLSRDKY